MPHNNIETSTLPEKGDIVTFSYEALARRSAPLNPVIHRIRTDISWEDVLSSSPSLVKVFKFVISKVLSF